MDHLPVPNDRNALGLTIPYIADRGPTYDGCDWKSFPSRCKGYEHTLLDGNLRRLDKLEHATTENLQTFFQSWMYFGLLSEFFSDVFGYCEDDFIRKPRDARGIAVITTKELNSYIGAKMARLLVTNAIVQIDEVRQETKRLHDLIITASKLIHEWDLKLAYVDESWTFLILSTKVLIETLYVAFSRAFGVPPGHLGSTLTPSLDLVRKHMTDNNWCPCQVNTLCSQVSILTLLYLANLRRHVRPDVDHSACASETRCIANNIPGDSFDGKHVSDECTCDHIPAPTDDMMKILRDGGIPVLSCVRKPDGKITTQYIRASFGLQYTAISHVWADGLGNARANSLPECQLQRVVSLAEKTLRSLSDHSTVHECEGGACRSRIVDAVSRRLGSLRSKRPKELRVNIWLDVYCVPVLPSPTNRALIPGEDNVFNDSTNESLEQVIALKKAAILRMDATYSWAKCVLILDYELSQVEKWCKELEFLARVATCSWNTRCWTYQEYALSRFPVYQCKFGTTYHVYQEGYAKNRELNLAKFCRITTLDQSERMYGIHTDLERLALPSEPRFGSIDERKPYETYEPHRSADPAVKRFTNAWSAFVDRNSTKPEDLIGIFANLLTLSASKILKQDGMMRMKAIIASQTRLPLSLLFIDVERRPQLLKSNPSIRNAYERWMPVSPQSTRPLWDRMCGFHMDVTPDGLLLSSSEIARGTSARLFQVSIGSGSEWSFQIGLNRYSVTVDRHELDCCVMDGMEVAILVLDTCHVDEVGTESNVGACLLPMPSSVDGPVATIYVCPVRWEMSRDESHSFRNEESPVSGRMWGADDLDILISSNIASWPRSNLDRYRVGSGMNEWAWTVYPWIFIIGGCLYMGSMLAIYFTTPRTKWWIVKTAIAATLLPIPIYLTMSLVAHTIGRAFEYLMFQTMEADTDLSRPWWERLDQVLLVPNREIPDLGERMQVRVLKGVVLMAKLCAFVKTRVIRVRGQDDEGGIRLT